MIVEKLLRHGSKQARGDDSTQSSTSRDYKYATHISDASPTKLAHSLLFLLLSCTLHRHSPHRRAPRANQTKGTCPNHCSLPKQPWHAEPCRAGCSACCACGKQAGAPYWGGGAAVLAEEGQGAFGFEGGCGGCGCSAWGGLGSSFLLATIRACMRSVNLVGWLLPAAVALSALVACRHV